MIEPEIKRIEVSEDPEEKKPKKEKKSKKWKVLFFLLIVAGAATFGFFKFKSIQADKAIEEQLSLLKEGKIKNAYEITSKDFKEETSLETFNTFIEQHPSFKKNKSYDFTERKEEGNIIILKGELISEDGNTTHVQYKIIKESNKWKIYGIEITSS
ncbi:MAG: DUF4864 domain-containing protein [Candidatus Pacebacteria bacterium]|nr:DUF4864 domain-containing protein [Candidatus Paceibacterota bacterium]